MHNRMIRAAGAAHLIKLIGKLAIVYVFRYFVNIQLVISVLFALVRSGVKIGR